MNGKKLKSRTLWARPIVMRVSVADEPYWSLVTHFTKLDNSGENVSIRGVINWTSVPIRSGKQVWRVGKMYNIPKAWWTYPLMFANIVTLISEYLELYFSSLTDCHYLMMIIQELWHVPRTYLLQIRRNGWISWIECNSKLNKLATYFLLIIIQNTKQRR